MKWISLLALAALSSSACLESDLSTKTACRYGGDCVTGLLCHDGQCMTRAQADQAIADEADASHDMPPNPLVSVEESRPPTSSGGDSLMTLRITGNIDPVDLSMLRVNVRAIGMDTWSFNFALVDDADGDGRLSKGDALEVLEPTVDLIGPDDPSEYVVELRRVVDPNDSRTRPIASIVWSF